VLVGQSEGRRDDPAPQHCGRQQWFDDGTGSFRWGVLESLGGTDDSGCSETD
jgi:hypothetical protein